MSDKDIPVYEITNVMNTIRAQAKQAAFTGNTERAEGMYKAVAELARVTAAYDDGRTTHIQETPREREMRISKEKWNKEWDEMTDEQKVFASSNFGA